MRYKIVLPELGLPHMTVSSWLVERGKPVIAGERLVEILADGVTVDLPAPASGTLVKTLVSEDDPVVVGQILGWISEEPS